MKKHNQWESCNKTHPKVCSRILTNGREVCGVRDCGKYHPKMCYSSMNTKVCTKVKCTYWHCKGTRFAPEATARYEAPSRYSLEQYPSMPPRRGRSPVRRELEERRHPREEELGRRDREDIRRREEEEERRRREERGREERIREGRKKDDNASFLDMAQMIRQEVQRALLTLLPLPGASGSSPAVTPAVPRMPNWAEMIARNN